jgi:uncharacterized membrane protein
LLSGLVILAVRRIIANQAVDQLAKATTARDAVRAIVEITTGGLTDIAWSGILIGLLVALFAVLVGPSRLAVAIRRIGAPVFSNRLTVWIAGVVVVLIAVALVPQFAVRTWFLGLVLLVMFAAGVEFLRRLVLEEYPDTSSPEPV